MPVCHPPTKTDSAAPSSGRFVIEMSVIHSLSKHCLCGFNPPFLDSAFLLKVALPACLSAHNVDTHVLKKPNL